MHFSTFSVFGSLPFVISNFVMPDPRQFMLLMLSASSAPWAVFITYAYRFAPASEISIYNYSGILFSIVLGAAILGEPVKSTSILGGALLRLLRSWCISMGIRRSRLGNKVLSAQTSVDRIITCIKNVRIRKVCPHEHSLDTLFTCGTATGSFFRMHGN